MLDSDSAAEAVSVLTTSAGPTMETDRRSFCCEPDVPKEREAEGKRLESKPYGLLRGKAEILVL